jgi:hypothetical protein
VPWVFDAAWGIWAYLKFAPHKPAPVDSSIRALKIGWAWTEEIEKWIENGKGTVSIDSLGRVASLSPRTVLLAAADRFESISWGLAGRYRKVMLATALAEED